MVGDYRARTVDASAVRTGIGGIRVRQCRGDPVVSLLVTPLALAGAVLPPDWAAPLLWIAHKALEWLVGGLAWLAAPAWAVWEAAHPGPVATGLALAGVYVLLIPVRRMRKVPGECRSRRAG
jgi:hypothetical protein